MSGSATRPSDAARHGANRPATGKPLLGSRVATLRDALRTQPPATTLTRAARTPFRVASWALGRAGLRIQVEGRPHRGPAVIVSNHPNLIDGLIVLFADPTMRPIARWHRVPLLRAGMWIADCLITTTGTPVQPHRGAYADALAHLLDDGRVWIAPEGGWQPLLTLRYPRTGAVRLAHAAGVPIQALGIVHGEHPGPTLATWRGWPRPSILLRWGPVVTPTGDLESDIDRMMTAVAHSCGARWRSPRADATE